MSQTNPRKAGLRTPNGTDTSPAAASSDAPAQSVPQPIHHPLPKHPHTYIPAHLKSNGPRTQHPRGKSSKSNTPADESPEIKALRAKYGDKLSNLKETFGTWGDEDLLYLLSESNGNVDSVATMILEGRAEHWDSVSHKKKDKATPTGVTGGPHTAARDRAEAGGSASPGIGGGRGGFRGGRGGTPGRGGARGGRGGGAGGRGGFANGSGKVALTQGADGTTASSAAENPPAGADAWGSADPSASSWGTEVAWGESASGASKEKEAPVPTKTPPVKGQQQSSKAPAKAQAPAGPPKMSWAQIAKKGKPVEPPVAPPVKAPAPVPPPSLPATSSAQPVSEPTPSEPPAAPEPEPTPVDSTTDPVEESADLEPQPTDEDGPEEATTAPSDDWIAVTPPNQIPVELPTTTAPAVEESKPVEAEVKPITTEAPKAPESTPATQQSSSVSTLQPTGAPPGLSPVPQPASTPSTTTVTSPAATVASTAATSVPAKSSTPRLGSSRPASRFRTTDAPVVMPGGGLPTTVFGSLSFGNAITADVPSFGGPGLESRFGMQFGSLSLNDDIDGSGPTEPAEAPAPVSQQEPPAPVTIAEPEPAPAPAPVPAPVPVPTQAAAPAPAPAPQPPQPVPQPVVAPQPTAPAQPVQQSPRVLSSSTAINSLFQHAQQPAQQSLPQQVATPPSLNATQPPPPQQPTPSAPSKVDALPPFLQQGAPGLLSHLQQPSHHVSQSQQQPPASHLPPHLSQPQQLGSPAQQSQQLAGSQGQQSLPYNVGGGQHLPPHLDTSSLPQTQQPASATSISAPHPALAAQNSYFRNAGADSFYHAPTPPQTQLPQQLQQQDHSSPYGAFSPLGQPQQTQGGHLGGFGSSPAGADYGYDQRGGFYDSYAQGSGFQNRPQLAHDEPAKGGLQPSTPTNVLPGQQNLNLGQGQPGGAQSGVANPGPGFGMMPYPYYQQPAYFPPPVPAQYNPYSQYKYNPYSQPPPGPGGPGPQGLQGNKPPTTGTASPYGSQHYPSQSTPYDDPTSVGYQQGTTSAADYQKQQPLYGGQGLQNFFGNQSTGQNGPQLGGAQGGRASATSSSPENPYKAYGSGPGVGADKSAAGQQGGAGRAAGGPGPQPQQGGYYPNNQYSTQRQPPAQGYPQGDGQQYYSGYQRNQYSGAW